MNRNIHDGKILAVWHERNLTYDKVRSHGDRINSKMAEIQKSAFHVQPGRDKENAITWLGRHNLRGQLGLPIRVTAAALHLDAICSYAQFPQPLRVNGLFEPVLITVIAGDDDSARRATRNGCVIEAGRTFDTGRREPSRQDLTSAGFENGAVAEKNDGG